VPGEFGVLAKVHIAAGTTVHFAKADVVLHVRPPGWICKEQNAFLATPEHVLLPADPAGHSERVFDCRVGGILQAINSSVGDSAKRMPNAQHFWRPAAHNKGHMYILITRPIKKGEEVLLSYAW
jgi:hypothetical protein